MWARIWWATNSTGLLTMASPPPGRRRVHHHRRRVRDTAGFRPSDRPRRAHPPLQRVLRSTTAYTITGIRFYLPTTSTSTYTVTLWSSSGTKLATASGSPTSATAGWRTVNLTTPVRIAANTTYVASVRALTAQYSWTASVFRTSYTNATLSVPASGSVTSSADVPASSSTTNYGCL